MEPSILQVVLMGVLTVFLVLVIIIFLIKLMGAIVGGFSKSEKSAAPIAATAPAAPAATKKAPQKNNGQLVAAIATAIAEEMGEDVSHIKIHSIKKL